MRSGWTITITSKTGGQEIPWYIGSTTGLPPYLVHQSPPGMAGRSSTSRERDTSSYLVRSRWERGDVSMDVKFLIDISSNNFGAPYHALRTASMPTWSAFL